jgi:hypothetical protein
MIPAQPAIRAQRKMADCWAVSSLLFPASQSSISPRVMSPHLKPLIDAPRPAPYCVSLNRMLAAPCSSSSARCSGVSIGSCFQVIAAPLRGHLPGTRGGRWRLKEFRAADSTWLGNRPPRSPCPRAKPNWARGSGSSYGLKKIVKAVANAPMMTSANTKSNRSVFMVPSATSRASISSASRRPRGGRFHSRTMLPSAQGRGNKPSPVAVPPPSRSSPSFQRAAYKPLRRPAARPPVRYFWLGGGAGWPPGDLARWVTRLRPPSALMFSRG